MQNLECKMQNTKFKIQNAKCKTDAAERGQRLLANYAEPQGGKACEAGLMQNAECRISFSLKEGGILFIGTPPSFI